MDQTTGTLKVMKGERVILASESSIESEDVESVYSVQGKDTECVRDTSDINDSDTSASFRYEISGRHLEYEIESLDDRSDGPFSMSDSEASEDINEIAALGTVAAAVSMDNGWDIGLDADTSSTCSTSPTSNSDVDPELSQLDYVDFEMCCLCKQKNNDSKYQWCEKCFNKRKNFFPKRQAKRKKKMMGSNNKKMKTKDEIQSTQESGIDMASGSQATTTSDESAGDQVDGAMPSTSSSSSVPANSDNPNICETCFSNPENGIIVHGKTAHKYGCYNCAFKIWTSTNSCPLCRRRVKYVVRLLNP